MGQASLYRTLSEEQMLEICMRQGVEMGFDALLGEELGHDELRGLKDVFFRLLYRPEFGDRMRERN